MSIGAVAYVAASIAVLYVLVFVLVAPMHEKFLAWSMCTMRYSNGLLRPYVCFEYYGVCLHSV